MSATPSPDEIQHISQQTEGARVPDAAPAASASRSRTWAHGVPAMRLQRSRWRLSGRPASAAGTGEGAAEPTASAKAPRFPPRIRVIRASVGVGLLVLAWIGAMSVYMLARATFAPLSRRRLILLLAPRLVEGLGTCLLAVVVATLLVVGAFALSLAVHPNDPEPASRSDAARAEQ